MAAASSFVFFPSLSTNHISSLQCRNYLHFPKLFKSLSIKCTSTKTTLKIDAINDNDSSAQNKTLREICKDKVPHHILNRVEELGFLIPTDVQEQSLPIMLSGSDCILQAQTGSGKTLAYLLPIFASITGRRASVQAVIVVPTRELGMQVAKVARAVASPSNEGILEKQNVISIMALLDGGTLKRQSTWLRAEPPQLVVATLGGLCQMVEKGRLKLDALRTLVIDEVDSIFGSDTQVSMLRKVLTSYSSSMKRQTILASASIPQHRRFVHNCIQHKWTKRDVVHVHVHPIEPMPSRLTHRYVACQKDEKYKVLLSLIISDAPKSAIVFINEQSIKSKKLGEPPTAETILEFLRESYGQTSGGKSHNDLEVSVLDESMNINERTTALSDMRKGSCVLIATDLAARGLDIPETSHIYNFDLPKSAIHYIHRAGRSGRKPFSDEKCIVTNLLTKDELFVLKQFENTLLFDCHEISLSICP